MPGNLKHEIQIRTQWHSILEMQMKSINCVNSIKSIYINHPQHDIGTSTIQK